MNIVCINGSPRTKGNSATIAGHFCETAEKNGATVNTFFINKMNYKGCQGCNACKEKSEKCVIKDDLADVLEAVRECDLLVMASPVYYGDVSSQLKAFIDRTYSTIDKDFVSRLDAGKKALFILAQADPSEESYKDIYTRYSTFFKMMGFEDAGAIRACGVGAPGEVADREDIMKQAEDMARKIGG